MASAGSEPANLRSNGTDASHYTTEATREHEVKETRETATITVHTPRVDPRKECESCGNARFRELK
jgi:hypothetical protein